MTNSIDLDQLAPEEASWSGFALFAKVWLIWDQLDQGSSADSAQVVVQVNGLH